MDDGADRQEGLLNQLSIRFDEGSPDARRMGASLHVFIFVTSMKYITDRK